MFGNVANAARVLFGYDAVNHSGKRRVNSGRIRAEHNILKPRDRRKLMENTRDLQRNYTVVQWAIRKHLDFVSSFQLQFKTDDETLNSDLERYIKDWGMHCDFANRHPLRRLIRLIESHRVVDGNIFINQLRNGKLQVFEDDRIANATDDLPNNMKLSDDWVDGIFIDPSSKAAKKYMITDRDEKQGSNARIYRGIAQARHMIHMGYYTRIDQYRGVSPIVAGLNTFQDTYEGFDAALMKLKIAQMFGIVFFRDADEAPGDLTGGEDADGEEDKSGYSVDFGKGPQMLDLDPGDDIKFIEGSTPPKDTQLFLQLMIQVALKSLDIPFSFFDESFTNFYGSRGGMIQYRKSCEDKQADLKDVLNQLTRWRLRLAVLDKEIALPAGMEINELKWDWVPSGVPWWDPNKEVTGHVAAIAAGLDNPQRVCQESGTDFYDNIRQRAKAEEYAEEHGIQLNLKGTGLVVNDLMEEKQKSEVPGNG